MELLNISVEEFKLFVMIFIRISVVIFLFPILGSSVVPKTAKAGFALVFAIILVPVVQLDLKLFPNNTVSVLILMVSEFFIGLILGLTVRLFFAGVQLAGRIIGFQMGFMMANVVDPMSGESLSIVEQIGYWVALLAFLIMNGHHLFIYAIVESFHIVNIGVIHLNEGLYSQIVKLSSDLFAIAIKIGAPAIAALLFTSVAFGICAKFMPQMNILIVGFPVKITVGLLFFGFSLQIIIIFVRSFLERFPYLLMTLLKLIGTS